MYENENRSRAYLWNINSFESLLFAFPFHLLHMPRNVDNFYICTNKNIADRERSESRESSKTKPEQSFHC